MDGIDDGDLMITGILVRPWVQIKFMMMLTWIGEALIWQPCCIASLLPSVPATERHSPTTALSATRYTRLALDILTFGKYIFPMDG